MRAEEAATVVVAAAGTRDDSTEVVLASENKAEEVVTGVGEAVDAGMASNWREGSGAGPGNSGETSRAAWGGWSSLVVLGPAM